MIARYIAAAAIVVLIGAALLVATRARARIAEGGPDPLDRTESLAEQIKPGRTLHILYVHGMRASGAGASDDLVALLRRKLDFTPRDDEAREEGLDVGPRPELASYLGQPIWKDDSEWAASRPFVRRRVLERSDHARVVVDEVNWWPLLFPLKCRFLVVPEHDLSGNDRQHIDLCARDDPAHHYYPWLGSADLTWLSGKPKGGGAALGNRLLKQQIMNWGLADAVIVSGPMHIYANRAMDRAFDYARRGAGDDDRFIVMSESLGSFVVMDAMRAGMTAVVDVMERTDDLYFFANQFALLELGRLKNLAPEVEDAAGAPTKNGASLIGASANNPATPLDALAAWANGPRRTRRGEKSLTDRPRQIIAFSDPSDLLTFRVPHLKGAVVVNLYDRNATRWLYLFENPAKAHAGHLNNAAVWKVLIRRRASY